MNKNYFYIIQRDNSIFEIGFDEALMKNVLQKWSQSGIIFLESANTSKPIGINGADIKNVLAYEDYMSWVHSSKPKEYIVNGNWYDSKENKIIRHEDWKQRKLESQKKIESGQDEVMTSEKWKSLRAKIDSVGEQLRVSGIIK